MASAHADTIALKVSPANSPRFGTLTVTATAEATTSGALFLGVFRWGTPRRNPFLEGSAEFFLGRTEEVRGVVGPTFKLPFTYFLLELSHNPAPYVDILSNGALRRRLLNCGDMQAVGGR